MSRQKDTLFYAGVIGLFSALMYWVVQLGRKLETGSSVGASSGPHEPWADFLGAVQHSFASPVAVLLGQIVAIILAARLMGALCRLIGQPAVVGEMAAGILLGPSLLGRYFPEVSAVLFPVKSLDNIKFLSQIGLILFRGFAPTGVGFVSFSLFMGIAMSITAFPVLARIVQERGIHKTPLGTLVITCAAADDVTAWCLLAAVIALVKAGSFVSALFILGLTLWYVLVMLLLVRPLLQRFGAEHSGSHGRPKKAAIALFFFTLICSAYVAEVIGIHALFGAFLAGAIMPADAKLRETVTGKVQDVAVVLLLPLFFVFTGLRTEIGLLNEGYLWGICAIIIVVAVAGKFLGSALAARFVGHTWAESLSIGALMNTRGLMELVVLNIGYDLGILTPQVFAMMVIMALATTCMTGPALNLIGRWQSSRA